MKKKFPDYTDPKTGIVYKQISDEPFRDTYGQMYLCRHCDLYRKPACATQHYCIENKTVYKLKPIKKAKSMKTFPDFTVPKEQNPLVAGINALKAENEKLKTENQHIKDANKLLNARAHSAEEQVTMIKAERIAAVSAVENLHSSCSKMQEELGVLRETNKKLKANKDAAASAAESLHSSCNKLQRELNVLRVENKMLKDLVQTESVCNNRLNLECALKELDALRAANKQATEALLHAMAYAIDSQGSYEAAIKEQKDYAHKLECHLIEAAKENAELIKELDSYRCKKRGWFSKAPKDTDPDVLETMMRLQQEIVNLRDALGVPR